MANGSVAGQPEASGGTPEAGFHLRLEKGRQLLHLKVFGFWSLETAQTYEKAMREMFEHLKGAPWYVLGDARDSLIQSQEVAKIRQELLDYATKLGMVRVAYLIRTPLPKMQLRRLSAAVSTESGFFMDESEAVEWLFRPASAPGG